MNRTKDKKIIAINIKTGKGLTKEEFNKQYPLPELEDANKKT